MSAIWMTLSRVLVITAVILGAGALWALWRHHSTRGAVLAAWSAAGVVLSGVAFWAWAIYSDHDNIEYGLRPERLILPLVLAVTALALGVWSSVRLLRKRGATREAAS